MGSMSAGKIVWTVPERLSSAVDPASEQTNWLVSPFSASRSTTGSFWVSFGACAFSRSWAASFPFTAGTLVHRSSVP